MDKGTLNLHTSFLPLAFVLYFIKPRLEVDGQDVPISGWGKSSHAIAAGPRRITVYFPYISPKRAGEATFQITVPTDGQVSLRYRAPVLVFQSGKLEVIA